MAKFKAAPRWALILAGVIVLFAVFLCFQKFILPALAGVGGIIGYLFRHKPPRDPVSQADRRMEQDAYRKIDAVKEQATATDEKQKSLDKRVDNLEDRIAKRRSGPRTTMIYYFFTDGGGDCPGD